jgi:hypothetical protein
MAYNNNIYGNAAFCGALEGIMNGRTITSSTATDYATQCNAAAAFASELDSLIAFDALVSTGAGITQLAITTNTIAANEQWRAGLLQALSRAYFADRNFTDTTVADYATAAGAVKAVWTQGLTKLVTP